MSIAINQRVIIERINQYMKYNGLAIHANEQGICNGLAWVYIKYQLEGKSERFFDILRLIAGAELQTDISDDEVNHFIVEILVAFKPGFFEPGLSQASGYRTLTVNEQPVKPVFNFSMVDEEKNWVKCIKELALRDNEAVHVGGVGHALVFHKTSNGYRIFDPNYKTGYKDFLDERQLIHELHQRLPIRGHRLLGMSLQIIRDPKDHTTRIFPSALELYQNHLTDVNAVTQTTDRSYSSLYLAASHAPMTQINYLLERMSSISADDVSLAAHRAVAHNNAQALFALRKQMSAHQQKKLLTYAVTLGNEQAFKALLMGNRYNSEFMNYFRGYSFIADAATGGNPLFLQQCLRLHQDIWLETVMGRAAVLGIVVSAETKESWKQKISKNLSLYLIAQLQTNDNGVFNAVKSGSLECLTILVQHLASTGHQLSDAGKLYLLEQAIVQNDVHMVSELIALNPGIAKDVLQQIHLPVKTVKKSSVHLLQTLKENGIPFSSAAESVFAKKRHQPISFIQELGIYLTKFTEFIKEYLPMSSKNYKDRLLRDKTAGEQPNPVPVVR